MVPVVDFAADHGHGTHATFTAFAVEHRVASGVFQHGQRVVSAETARQVREMLRLAAGPGGTAPKAMAQGYSVGGKTGTARKQEGKTYTNKYRAWFVGLAPAVNPRIVVAVMVDEPTNGLYFGGDVAAPVFSQTVQQTLRMMGVQPDMAVKPQVISKAEKEEF